jgi:DNA-binding IclR family transcriptional regulator
MNEMIASSEFAERSPVMKALRLLAHIAASQEAPGLAELSRAMNLPKPTTHRLARALESAGYIVKDPLTLRYHIGLSFEDIALKGLRNSAAHGYRRRIMSELAERLEARVNLVVLKSGNLSFVQWVDSTAPLRINVSGDMPMPVHCSASGKLLLAFGPKELRDAVMRQAPFERYTKNTITTATRFARHLDEILKRGYSADDQELMIGLNCLAVPIQLGTGQTVAGLAVMAPTAMLPLDKMKQHLPEIKAAAALIAAEFGRSPASARGAAARTATNKSKRVSTASVRKRTSK